MNVLAVSFLCSLLISLWVLRFSHIHSRFTADSDLSGVQKFHAIAVPRIGGVGIFVGVLLALCVRYFQNSSVDHFGLLLIFSALPAFLIGLLEDVTKRVEVKVRLLACMASAGLAGYLFNAWLGGLQIFGFDSLMLAYPAFSILITCFAVSGVANAFNIIDGYNGLSSMVAVIILSGLAYVAFQVSDFPIMISALAMIGALFGFLVWNYPRGLIFLGDGGAYFIGFWIAELSVLLTSRHPEVSKWFPLLLCFYPIFETLFTIYRRAILRRTHPGMPDASHLHQLIYMRIIRWSTGSDDGVLVTERNSMTSPYLWVLAALSVIPAILFWRYHIVLKAFSGVFAVVYVWIYWSIVRFKAPLWLRIRNHP
ncbi:glycosyltransferase family 4 protein [Polynucleobacter sp. AP-Jannik-300A-C4]|uniref:MraY family glycosyltransferase n=1 Tax=Polynucleobacter sp. AP-Jannik-300A-C4 TaxID=2576928 RepID=UPI001BFDAF3E|nr:glycosyltransferase [Polynucleobacter sp. AP-Jannik-300A-C4]QWE22958.1 glycosyltransferase family 4 protein [Polynucleobacter sp. AP-Jannik-300A-C4]